MHPDTEPDTALLAAALRAYDFENCVYHDIARRADELVRRLS
jgi:hypothetical protein